METNQFNPMLVHHIPSFTYHVEILMVIVVENRIGLPGLPPIGLEIDSGMVNDSMIIRVDGHHVEHHCGSQRIPWPTRLNKRKDGKRVWLITDGN